MISHRPLVGSFVPLALASALVLTGCDDSPTEPDPVPATIEVSPEALAFEALGATEELEVQVLDADGNPIQDANVTWDSSDEDVVTVEDGLVTAVAAGEAEITVSSGDASASVDVTVEQVPSQLEVSPTQVEFTELGATEQLEGTVRDAEGTEVEGAEISWASDDESVATVSEGGELEAVGEGTATVTATSGELEGTVDVAVELEG